jgi:hypothetical protein
MFMGIPQKTEIYNAKDREPSIPVVLLRLNPVARRHGGSVFRDSVRHGENNQLSRTRFQLAILCRNRSCAEDNDFSY